LSKPEPQKFNKAKLIIHRQDKPDKEIQVMFNPDKYSIKKSNNFASHTIPGTNYPQIQFVSGNSETMNVELFFDTYTFEGGKDVREEYTNKISDLLDVDDKLHAPPTCTFVWGDHPFTGIIESVDRTFTMFNEQGTPVRETLTLNLKQYKEHIKIKDSSTNNTKNHTVKEGDSLWSLAEKAFGDTSKWKIIASVNNIDDPLNLKLGVELTIPPLN